MKDRHPDIPWRQIIGMRNVLTHGYLSGPDDDIVWRVIEDDLDALKRCIAAELH
ncbi:MAG: HepT-like ribonuclease domain-containing protein [Candidatus Dormibacteria bacterium]